MKEKEIINLFNKVINDMFLFMMDNYNKDINFDIYYDFYKKIVKKNKKILIKQFLKHIYLNDDYRENILEKNDNFFVNKDIEGFGLQKIMIKKIFSFKKKWNIMDDDDKEYIKNCMVALIKITEKFVFL